MVDCGLSSSWSLRLVFIIQTAGSLIAKYSTGSISMEPFHSCSRATFHRRKSLVVGKLTLWLDKIESPMTHLLKEPNFEAFTIENRKKSWSQTRVLKIRSTTLHHPSPAGSFCESVHSLKLFLPQPNVAECSKVNIKRKLRPPFSKLFST